LIDFDKQETACRIISKQLMALEDIVRETRSSGNTTFGFEQLGRWKEMTIALLAEHVSEAEAAALRNKKPGSFLRGRPLRNFLARARLYDAFLVSLNETLQRPSVKPLVGKTPGHGTAVSVPNDDQRFARMAIEEAKDSIGEDDRVHPKVGVVIVKDGKILSTAHRGESPEGHAEYIALEKKLADAAVAGATVYTTLEPCTTRNHPKIPCVQRLIERKVARVVIGMLDPNPAITGRGQRRLRSANIITDFFPNDLMSEVEELNREFTRQFESVSGSSNSTHPVVEIPAGNTVQAASKIVDKWVSLGYEHKSGVAKTLAEHGFDLGWVSADREAERIDFEGWEYVLVDQPDGKRARLKIRDSPAVGGYLVLLKRCRPAK
jgi:pyrimidine deaminase RibD-like protein